MNHPPPPQPPALVPPRVIPTWRLTAAAVPEAIVRGQAAVDRLVAAGMPAGDRNRLVRALDVLQGVAAAGRYPTQAQARNEVIDALQTLGDLFELSWHIHSALHDEVLADIAKVIYHKPGKRSMQEQFGAQAFLGLVLGASGRPASPIVGYEERRPDYRWDTGDMVYCVEVKRPESLQGLDATLKRAAKQLAAMPRPGIIALDLSTVLDHDTRDQPHRADNAFEALSQAIHDRLTVRIAGERAFARVVGAFMWLRRHYFDASEDSAPISTVYASASRFLHGYSGLLTPAHLELAQRLFFAGLETLQGPATRAVARP